LLKIEWLKKPIAQSWRGMHTIIGEKRSAMAGEK